MQRNAPIPAAAIVLAVALGAHADPRCKEPPCRTIGIPAQVAELEARVAALETLLASLSLEDGGRTLRATGVNVQIVSGSGATDGPVNGLGNLIVGYNEDAARNHCLPRVGCVGFPAVRTGSHNLVIGPEHTWTQFGGLVAGYEHALTGPFASVTGGAGNEASGSTASLSGGVSNDASGPVASVSGGLQNEASGGSSSVSGGQLNVASGLRASVSGGTNNEASADDASVSGGFGNTASGSSWW